MVVTGSNIVFLWSIQKQTMKNKATEWENKHTKQLKDIVWLCTTHMEGGFLSNSILYIPCDFNETSLLKRGERMPTRCNNIDVYCQFRCLISTTVSTCFGHLYAHHQEKKTICYCIWGCLLVVLDVAGCSSVVLHCRMWALWRLRSNKHTMGRHPRCVFINICM